MILGHFLWDYAGRLVSIVLNLGVGIILARILQPEDYGFMQLVITISAMAMIFQDFGFGSAIVQQKEMTQQQLSTIFFISLSSGIIICLAIFLTAGLIADYYGAPKIEAFLQLSLIGILFSSLNVVPFALIQKKMLFKQQAIRNATTSLIIGGFAVLMAFNGWGVWSLLSQILLATVSNALINFWITQWRPSWDFNLKSIHNTIGFGTYIFLSNVSNTIFTRIDTLLIPKMFDVSTLGHYSRAQSIDNMVKNVSSSSLQGVLFPFFSKVIDDKELMLKLWERYFHITCISFFFITGISFIGANYAFLTVYGQQWDTAANYYKLLSISGFVFPLSALSLSIIQAKGKGKDYLLVEVLKKICLIPTFFVAYYAGMSAYLIALATANLIMLFLNLLFLRRSLDYPLWTYVLYALEYFLVTILFIGSYTYLSLVKFIDIYNFLHVSLFVLLFIVYYISIVFLRRRDTFRLIVQSLIFALEKISGKQQRKTNNER